MQFGRLLSTDGKDREGLGMKEEIEVSMAEIAAILLKRWWLIILSALVVAAGAFGVTKFIVEEGCRGLSIYFPLAD
jgi:hypothetical protein